MKDKNKMILYYIALLAGIGALIASIFEINFKNLETKLIINSSLWLIYILSMLISIKDLKNRID